MVLAPKPHARAHGTHRHHVRRPHPDRQVHGRAVVPVRRRTRRARGEGRARDVRHSADRRGGTVHGAGAPTRLWPQSSASGRGCSGLRRRRRCDDGQQGVRLEPQGVRLCARGIAARRQEGRRRGRHGEHDEHPVLAAAVSPGLSPRPSACARRQLSGWLHLRHPEGADGDDGGVSRAGLCDHARAAGRIRAAEPRARRGGAEGGRVR